MQKKKNFFFKPDLHSWPQPLHEETEPLRPPAEPLYDFDSRRIRSRPASTAAEMDLFCELQRPCCFRSFAARFPGGGQFAGLFLRGIFALIGFFRQKPRVSLRRFFGANQYQPSLPTPIPPEIRHLGTPLSKKTIQPPQKPLASTRSCAMQANRYSRSKRVCAFECSSLLESLSVVFSRITLLSCSSPALCMVARCKFLEQFCAVLGPRRGFGSVPFCVCAGRAAGGGTYPQICGSHRNLLNMVRTGIMPFQYNRLIFLAENVRISSFLRCWRTGCLNDLQDSSACFRG